MTKKKSIVIEPNCDVGMDFQSLLGREKAVCNPHSKMMKDENSFLI